MFINRGVDKDVVCMYVYTHTHTHTGILLSHKKEQNNAIYSNMYGPWDCQTQWSQRERQIYDITYMWNLKKGYKWTYLQHRQSSDVKNKLMPNMG